MKKITFALLITFTTILFSCQSDDDATTNDPIVGKWKYTSQTINGVESEFDECEKKSTITFLDNKSVISNDFFEEEGVCTEEIYRATWELLENGFYSLQDEEDDEEQLFKPVFQGNTMVIEIQENINEDGMDFDLTVKIMLTKV